MISEKYNIVQDETNAGTRLLSRRRRYNARKLRLDQGGASMEEVVDALFDDLPFIDGVRGGGGKNDPTKNGPTETEIREARKESKWVLKLMYNAFGDVFTYLKKTGETVEQTEKAKQTIRQLLRKEELKGGERRKSKKANTTASRKKTTRKTKTKKTGKTVNKTEKEQLQHEFAKAVKEEEKDIQAALPVAPLDTEVAKRTQSSVSELFEHDFIHKVMQMSPEEKKNLNRLLDIKDEEEFQRELNKRGIFGRTWMRFKRLVRRIGKAAWDWKWYLIMAALVAATAYCAWTHETDYAPNILDNPNRGVGWNTHPLLRPENSVFKLRGGSAYYVLRSQERNAKAEIAKIKKQNEERRKARDENRKSRGVIVTAVCDFINNYVRGGWNAYVKHMDTIIDSYATEGTWFGGMFGGVGGGIAFGGACAAFGVATFGFGMIACGLGGATISALAGSMTGGLQGKMRGVALVGTLHMYGFLAVLKGWHHCKTHWPSLCTQHTAESMDLMYMTQGVVTNFGRAHHDLAIMQANKYGMFNRMLGKAAGLEGVLDVHDRIAMMPLDTIDKEGVARRRRIDGVFRDAESELYKLADDRTKALAKRMRERYGEEGNDESSKQSKKKKRKKVGRESSDDSSDHLPE